MPQYGLTKEAIESGDLRIMLAVTPNGTDDNRLFERVRKMDDLLGIREGKRPTITYNMDALGRYNNLQKTLRTLHPFKVDGQAVQGPCGLFSRGTCVIAGTAPTLDKEFIKVARGYGLPIIGLGNISYTDVEMDFWLGRQDILNYLPKPMESQRIQAFVNEDSYGNGLWDPMTKKQAKLTPATCANTLSYSVSHTPFDEWLKDPRGVTDAGHDSSFTTALSLAVLMGCHNIILTGVVLGGQVDDFFVYDEVPHADSIKRKESVYDDIRSGSMRIYNALASYGIRTVSTGIINARIPRLPTDYLNRALHGVLALTKRIDPKRVKVTLPADSKRSYLKAARDIQQHMVTPTVILDKASAFIEKVPARFGSGEVKHAMDEYEKAKRQPGGCTGCMKGKVGRPLYTAFEQGVKDNDPVLLQAWAEILPDHYVLKTQLMQGTVMSEMVFREDRKDEEIKWKQAQI